jgi:hypothetical protein
VLLKFGKAHVLAAANDSIRLRQPAKFIAQSECTVHGAAEGGVSISFAVKSSGRIASSTGRQCRYFALDRRRVNARDPSRLAHTIYVRNRRLLVGVNLHAVVADRATMQPRQLSIRNQVEPAREKIASFRPSARAAAKPHGLKLPVPFCGDRPATCPIGYARHFRPKAHPLHDFPWVREKAQPKRHETSQRSLLGDQRNVCAVLFQVRGHGQQQWPGASDRDPLSADVVAGTH